MSAGISIGEYDLIESLGAGGMATVYRAYHRRLKRQVAIKMIHHAYRDDPGFLARFQREAEIVASLEHPNIVPVYDFSEYHGQPYLVMKLVDGASLKAALSDGPLILGDILPILAPIGAALDYAHGRGVLHRDIKPSNIMLDQQRVPYLMDFGLARLTQSGESTLSSDMLIGTPNYMSPEQAQGDAVVDKRSDLYSFGVVLYELLVGQVPFSGGTPYAIIHDQIHRPLPAPRSINPDVPIPVEAVLFRALSKAPDDRYPSAGAMVEALLRAVDDSGLRSLNPERRHTLAESLSKKRPASPPLLLTQPIGVPADTPGRTQPGVPTVPVPSATVSAKSQRGGFLVGLLVGIGLLAIVLIAVLALRRPPPGAAVVPTLIVLETAASAAPTISDAAEPTRDLRPTLPPTWTPEPPAPTGIPTGGSRPNNAQPPPGQTGPRIDLAALFPNLVDVPELTLTDAQSRLSSQPDDPLSYLILARAQYGNADFAAATVTIASGLDEADADTWGYRISAARAALAENRLEVGLIQYALVLDDAASDPIFMAVRDVVGYDIFLLTNNPSLFNSVNLAVIQRTAEIRRQPIVAALVTRAALHNRLPRQISLAEGEIDALLVDNPTLSELHFVLGELRAAQGLPADAIAAWETARAAVPVPSWIVDETTRRIGSVGQPANPSQPPVSGP